VREPPRPPPAAVDAQRMPGVDWAGAGW